MKLIYAFCAFWAFVMASSTSPFVWCPVTFLAVTRAKAQLAYMRSIASRLSSVRRFALASERFALRDAFLATTAEMIAQAPAIVAHIISTTLHASLYFPSMEAKRCKNATISSRVVLDLYRIPELSPSMMPFSSAHFRSSSDHSPGFSCAFRAR